MAARLRGRLTSGLARTGGDPAGPPHLSAEPRSPAPELPGRDPFLPAVAAGPIARGARRHRSLRQQPPPPPLPAGETGSPSLSSPESESMLQVPAGERDRGAARGGQPAAGRRRAGSERRAEPPASSSPPSPGAGSAPPHAATSLSAIGCKGGAETGGLGRGAEGAGARRRNGLFFSPACYTSSPRSRRRLPAVAAASGGALGLPDGGGVTAGGRRPPRSGGGCRPLPRQNFRGRKEPK